MTIQNQELDSGHKTITGLLPGAFRDLWRELGLFTSTCFTLKMCRSSIEHNESFVVWCMAEADPRLKLSLCYSSWPQYNFVLSVVYIVFCFTIDAL